MFFKKRREAKEQAEKEEKQALEQGVSSALDEAGALTDVSGKIHRISEIETVLFRWLDAFIKDACWDYGNKRVKEVLDGDEHYQNMRDLYWRAGDMLDTEVEAHVREIATAPDCEELLKLPKLSDKFAAASAKYIAVEVEAEKVAAAEAAAKEDAVKADAPVAAPPAAKDTAPKDTVQEQKEKWSRITKLGH